MTLQTPVLPVRNIVCPQHVTFVTSRILRQMATLAPPDARGHCVNPSRVFVAFFRLNRFPV